MIRKCLALALVALAMCWLTGSASAQPQACVNGVCKMPPPTAPPVAVTVYYVQAPKAACAGTTCAKAATCSTSATCASTASSCSGKGIIGKMKDNRDARKAARHGTTTVLMVSTAPPAASAPVAPPPAVTKPPAK
jgi:hypothetical protein